MSFAHVALYLYVAVLGVLALYGLHRMYLVWVYRRRDQGDPPPPGRFSDLPPVTIQLPIYNEVYVVERLLDAVARLDYPRDRLEIQVLDDSTDETTALVAEKVAALRAAGLDIHHLRRARRAGYKAGALANGLTRARGEFIAIFDADFLPGPDFLQRTIHYFTDPRVGMVQTRWGHINRDYSVLTQVQSIFLDGHFVLEHTARHRSGRFFNFNGTGGIWRRAAIVDAGGWHYDTLTEDLDLSYRAQLRGWKFVFLKDVVAPAEVPVEINAFKSQQFRWAKGSAQTMKKLLPAIWRSRFSLPIKLEATFHLTANAGYPLMVLLSLLMLPAVQARATLLESTATVLVDTFFFFAAFVGVCYFYLFSQLEIRRPLLDALRFVPPLLAIGIGMCLNNSRAVLEGFFGVQSPFTRTPKHNVRRRGEAWRHKRYRGAPPLTPLLELAMAVYFGYTLAYAVGHGLWVVAGFLLLFLGGFLYVGAQSLYHRCDRAGWRLLGRPA